MKERIISFLLACVLVIGIFAVQESVRSFANVANETSNLEGEIKDIQIVDFPKVENKVIFETLSAEETIEPVEEIPEETYSEYYEDYFNAEITFESKYNPGDEVMPYMLYTPSTIDVTKKTPLIVWLHGSGEVGKSEDIFMVRGLPDVMSKWVLNGFNAYIICPHLSGNWNTGRWNAENTKNNLKNLLDTFINQHNIDAERIIIVGHSLGGQGAQYMAHELKEYFKKCVVLSGYNPGVDIKEITIPTIAYVGTTGAGEDGTSVNYTMSHLLETFGKDNVFSIQSSHGDLPYIAFNLDNDGNSNSDLVEWMLKK